MKVLRAFLVLFIPISGLAQTANWEPAELPYPTNDIRCIYNDTVGDRLYLGGWIKVGSGASSKIAIYDGSGWETLGKFSGPIETIISFGNGLLVGGGFSTVNDENIMGAVLWDGNNWVALTDWDPNKIGWALNFRVLDGDIYMLGAFDSIKWNEIHGIAKWNGGGWDAVHDFYVGATSTGSGIVRDAAIYKGKLYVAGNFDYNGITDMAVYDNGEWKKVGEGFTGGYNSIYQLEVYKDELYAIGNIYKFEGNVGHGIQKWDGQFWTNVGDGLQDLGGGQQYYLNGNKMVVHGDYLYVVGGYHWVSNIPSYAGVARWDGQQWCSDTTLKTEGGATALGFYHDTLFVGFGPNDSLINGVNTNCLAKYTGVELADTCSEVYPVGVNESNRFSGGRLDVYPNPSSNLLQVSFPSHWGGAASVRVFSIDGHVVMPVSKVTTQGGAGLSVEGLPPGVYMLEATQGAQRATAVFVKQ